MKKSLKDASLASLGLVVVDELPDVLITDFDADEAPVMVVFHVGLRRFGAAPDLRRDRRHESGGVVRHLFTIHQRILELHLRG